MTILGFRTSASRRGVAWSYVAARLGVVCARVNNREHADVAEYVGRFAPEPDGSIGWRNGTLTAALRRGEWLLDELNLAPPDVLEALNLAPPDVLEALNRLLDDNRELRIPETGEVVEPAPGIALFTRDEGGGPMKRAAARRDEALGLVAEPDFWRGMPASSAPRCARPRAAAPRRRRREPGATRGSSTASRRRSATPSRPATRTRRTTSRTATARSRTYTVAYGDHHAIVVVLLYTPGARDGPFYGLFRDHLRYFDVDSAECFATASEKPAVGPLVETLFEIGQTLGVEVSSAATASTRSRSPSRAAGSASAASWRRA
ncbi:midasin-like protein, partial [Aureococcus anophagefferens]